MSGCSILTLTQYKERHDKIGHYIHGKVCKYYEIFDCKNNINTSQNQSQKQKEQLFSGTYRKIKHNMTDFVVKTNKRKTYLLIDMSLQADNNILVKEHN